MPRSYRRDAKSRMASAQNQFRREQEGRVSDYRAFGQWDPDKGNASAYAQGMQAYRRSFGLTDGLRCSQSEMNDYLTRRRQEDQRLRGW